MRISDWSSDVCSSDLPSPEADGAAETLVRHLSGMNDTSVVSFATEGGIFQAAGLSTVVFGPGSIDQAHKPNEFITLAQVAACETFLLKLRDWADRRSTRLNSSH